MGSLDVDQIDRNGQLVRDRDRRLSEREKNAILIDALPGAAVETFAGARVVRYRDQVLLKKQVTHLGYPWPEFKKRIQIPKTWLHAHEEARRQGLIARFIGIYDYDEVTIFVDFDPATYVQRKANNSAAHVSTNDLHQAQLLGQFSRTDRNGNAITTVRADAFAEYIRHGRALPPPHVQLFTRFNAEFLTGQTTVALNAVQQMHGDGWPDTFQGEWPGFYLEYRLDSFLRRGSGSPLLEYSKDKRRGRYDYDLVFKTTDGDLDHYGDLKASDYVKHESPGNDAADILRCVEEYGRFWYVIYEHETFHARDNGDLATIQWNEWKRSVGYINGRVYNPLSYARRFKESVRFFRMMILEVNRANFRTVLGDFTQGKQPDGSARALKVMIKKRNIENFLIYSTTSTLTKSSGDSATLTLE